MGLVKTCMLLVLFSMAEAVATAQMQRPSPNYGEQSTFDFELRRWRADLVSELRLSNPEAIGSDFDPVLALGLPQQRTFDYHFGVRLTRRIKIRANWFRVRYAADTIVFEDLTISGTTFPTGTTLTSFLELEQRRGGIQYDLVTGQYGYLAVVGEWVRFSAKSDFSSPDAAVTPLPLTMDLPIFGLASRIYLTPALAVTTEALGMKREAIGVMTDVDVSITYNAVPSLGFSYGYRNSYNRFKNVEPASRAIFRLRGQYFGVTVRF